MPGVGVRLICLLVAVLPAIFLLLGHLIDYIIITKKGKKISPLYSGLFWQCFAAFIRKLYTFQGLLQIHAGASRWNEVPLQWSNYVQTERNCYSLLRMRCQPALLRPKSLFRQIKQGLPKSPAKAIRLGHKTIPTGQNTRSANTTADN